MTDSLFQFRCSTCHMPVGDPLPKELVPKGAHVTVCGDCAQKQRQQRLHFHGQLWQAIRGFCSACGGDPDTKAKDAGKELLEAVGAIDEILSRLLRDRPFFVPEDMSVESFLREERGRLDDAMAAIIRLDHTRHCAHRMAFGDGLCECGKIDLQGDPAGEDFGSAKPGETACSFCYTPQREVDTLIAGPHSLYICSECVKLSMKIIEEKA